MQRSNNIMRTFTLATLFILASAINASNLRGNEERRLAMSCSELSFDTWAPLFAPAMTTAEARALYEQCLDAEEALDDIGREDIIRNSCHDPATYSSMVSWAKMRGVLGCTQNTDCVEEGGLCYCSLSSTKGCGCEKKSRAMRPQCGTSRATE